MPVRDIDTTPIANPHDHAFNRDTMPLYLFSFGAYGSVNVFAWGCHSLDDALEAAAEWCAKHAPGVFTDPDYDDAANDIEAPEDWRDDPEGWGEKVRERAETDMTYTESGWILSYEWHVYEVSDADDIAYVQWRSREGNDADEGDYCIGQYRYSFDPCEGPADCTGE
jgi:hypothetical protein